MLYLAKHPYARAQDLLERVQEAEVLLKLMKPDKDVSQQFVNVLKDLGTVISGADEVVGPLRTDLYPKVTKLTSLCKKHGFSTLTSNRTSSAMDIAFYQTCEALDHLMHGTPVSTSLTALSCLSLMVTMSAV